MVLLEGRARVFHVTIQYIYVGYELGMRPRLSLYPMASSED